MKGAANAKGGNKFVRILSLPLRAICRARDFYVDRIIACTNTYGGAVSVSHAPLPRSFSRASSTGGGGSEDYAELVRAASVTWRNQRIEEELKAHAAAPTTLPPRSVSVGMGRIDEDRPISYFGKLEIGDGDQMVKEKVKKVGDLNLNLKYPRSKSHAVGRTTSRLF